MGELHAMLHQNWWSGFRDIAWHGTLNNKWMSLCIMERYISETWPPILMKLGMKFTHILIVNRGKFHLILPINKNFSLITTFCTNVFIHVYHVTLYLWNLTTNFDVTLHEVHPYTDSESWKVSSKLVVRFQRCSLPWYRRTLIYYNKDIDNIKY